MGVVRRIDELGRVVIPKEIRRTLRIREGDSLEINTNSDNEVVFRKFSPVKNISESAKKIADILSKLSGVPAIVFDKDSVTAVSGASGKEYSGRRLSTALEELLETRQGYSCTEENCSQPFYPAEGIKAKALCAEPIISDGDVIGAVILLAEKENQTAAEKQILLCKASALFLGKQIEL